uniref:Uncharacterized protein n=1 Tax=Arundo donax TaxID=35708 RepID=A0A0A9H1U0_ARUDO
MSCALFRDRRSLGNSFSNSKCLSSATSSSLSSPTSAESVLNTALS